MKEADILIYWGHAGLGLNFDFDIPKEEIRVKNLAFLSCYSYRYFNQNDLQKFNKLDGIFYTGNSQQSASSEIIKIVSKAFKSNEEVLEDDGFTFYKKL
jgi:hypothetical protein